MLIARVTITVMVQMRAGTLIYFINRSVDPILNRDLVVFQDPTLLSE